MFHNFFQLQDTSRSMLSKVVLAIVFGIIAFVTVVGNIMVMVSFKMDKQLQTISNYFLFRCFCFFTLPHWNFNMSSHGQPSDCRLHNRSIFDPILHNPTDREREVASQVFPILQFRRNGKLLFSQSGALRHLALDRLHGEQCKCDEPLGHIRRQVAESFVKCKYKYILFHNIVRVHKGLYVKL